MTIRGSMQTAVASCCQQLPSACCPAPALLLPSCTSQFGNECKHLPRPRPRPPSHIAALLSVFRWQRWSRHGSQAKARQKTTSGHCLRQLCSNSHVCSPPVRHAGRPTLDSRCYKHCHTTLEPYQPILFSKARQAFACFAVRGRQATVSRLRLKIRGRHGPKQPSEVNFVVRCCLMVLPSSGPLQHPAMTCRPMRS